MPDLPEISDEMVDAYVRAVVADWHIEMKGEELQQDVRAGLAAALPLLRAQLEAEHDDAKVEVAFQAWEAAAGMLTNAAKEAARRHPDAGRHYALGWSDAAAVIADSAAEAKRRWAEQRRVEADGGR